MERLQLLLDDFKKLKQVSVIHRKINSLLIVNDNQHAVFKIDEMKAVWMDY